MRKRERERLPSFCFNGFLITYLRTSSSFFKLNNLRILLALFGPKRLGTTRFVSPSISCSPVLKNLLIKKKKSNQTRF